MDIFQTLLEPNPATRTIKVVDMHTSGEGETLLEKRRCARDKHDDIRKRQMYGAILVQETELTRAGEADIGVLFCHNGEQFTLFTAVIYIDYERVTRRCVAGSGHATIALGRLLADTHDLAVFPRRNDLPYDGETGLTKLRLHAPCGIIRRGPHRWDEDDICAAQGGGAVGRR
ncbi:hypothetical protein C8F01DRAFT_1371118 [Mycena amicta]|nr:hypothetical protein C8F01DRAFT_1371118 [Mycena amicta]